MILKNLANKILRIKKETPVLIAIDGVDGAGKTIFAKKLASELRIQKRTIIQASVDDFHNHKAIRYKKGENSPEGFYFDSFNYQLLRNTLLNPFLLGEGEYCSVAFDHHLDSEIILPAKPVEKLSVLVMEGIFLLRPELVNYWDLKIFLDVDFKTTLQRNIQRSIKSNEIISVEKIIEKFNKRYMPGQQLYFEQANPKAQADIIIDNSYFELPKIIGEKTKKCDKEEKMLK